jgi:hypothetical protein
VWLVLHQAPPEEGEEEVTEPIDVTSTLCVSSSNGCVIEGETDGDPNYYLVRFFGYELDKVEDDISDEKTSLGVAMLPDEAAMLIRGLTELVSTHDPNALWDMGVVASSYPIPPQAQD